MTAKPRPTDAEFEELKRKRDAAIKEIAAAAYKKLGGDPSKPFTFHASGTHGCYCACPEGPCQHIWDGPGWDSEDGCASSTTCSLCGEVSMFHDMRVGP